MFTILIGTCDKYNYLWNDFVHLFNKYWDHSIECKKYFLSETISAEYEGFETFLPGKIPYSECIKFALDNISTDYVLWLQDDYLFRKTINKNQIDKYMDFITTFKVNRFGIHDDSTLYNKIHIKDTLYKLFQYSMYTISMQASIWEKDFFRSCLIHGENPWEFEINGSARLNHQRSHYIYYDAQTTPWYVEAMRKGNRTEDYYIVKEIEGL